jgi:class 3 adenylate cyclase
MSDDLSTLSKLDLITRLEGLQTEVTKLRQEITTVRKASVGTQFGTQTMIGTSTSWGTGSSANVGGARSIVGLDAKVLQLSEKDTIEYINSSLAKMLKVDQKAVRKKTLDAIDNYSWGKGVLTDLVRRCRTSGDLEQDLQYYDEVNEKQTWVKIRVSEAAGKIDIVIEDMTKLKSLESTFARYVSPAVIDRMKTSEKDFFASERRVMSVLFADLRGFTSYSQHLAPTEVRHRINQYLTTMVAAVMKFEGTIDKFVGDEVMAIFGAPVFVPDHAIRALQVALEMQRAHTQLCDEWKREGVPELELGIGINTGDMVAGNIGCEERMDYTVIGHHVNLASRLCGLAKGGQVLLGENTFQEISDAARRNDKAVASLDVKFKKIGQTQAKGIEKPVEIIAAIPKSAS